MPVTKHWTIASNGLPRHEDEHSNDINRGLLTCMRRCLSSISEGGMLAGLPGCRAMGRVARPWCTKASSSAVTPLCTLLTCNKQHCEEVASAYFNSTAESSLQSLGVLEKGRATGALIRPEWSCSGALAQHVTD